MSANKTKVHGVHKVPQLIHDPEIFDDWFLGSKNENQELYDELFLFGVGGFDPIGIYCSSSEVLGLEATNIYAHFFITGVWGTGNKNAVNHRVRPIRKFNSTTIYVLRDTGPSGGLIFHIIDLGAGLFTYYEAHIVDIEIGIAWSNIDNSEAGTDIIIGAGQTNTTAIISQVGHINSNAKLCDDLIL